jgi:hypothetical protein
MQTRRQYLKEAGLDYARVYPDDLNITKDQSGAWLVSAVFEGYRHALAYYGYKKQEAVKLYLDHYNTERN